MFGPNAVTRQLPRVSEFYHGKSIFITGASGFVGSVLLEILLECVSGIKNIYILLRTKKNVPAEVRKEQIFNKKIFEKLKKENSELLRKVHLISGDISLPNLGMNEEDMHLILEEASIVFHCAADINLEKPMEFLIKSNVLSLNRVIELCRKMRKFQVLVYTSTAFSNCNHLNFPLKEDVYRLPFHAGEFLNVLKKEDKEKLQELVAHCKPDWPNWYCFSKCLAENLIMDTALDIPVAIIRPSIVVSTWKQPFPGYVEEHAGIIAVLLGIGKGFIKVINADPNCKMDFVPADIVANAHVLAACSVGSKRCTSPLVLNCTATKNLQVKFSDYMETITQLFGEFPLPRSFKKHPKCITVPNKCLHTIIAAYYHYLPTIVLYGILRILGKNSRIYSRYHFLYKFMNASRFFRFHSFEFERNNLDYLNRLIHPKDRKVLSLDFRDATFLGMALSFPEGSPFYDRKIDKKSECERQRIEDKRHMLRSCIQSIFLIGCCLLIYWVFSCPFY